jgi:hypothetical protein
MGPKQAAVASFVLPQTLTWSVSLERLPFIQLLVNPSGCACPPVTYLEILKYLYVVLLTL